MKEIRSVYNLKAIDTSSLLTNKIGLKNGYSVLHVRIFSIVIKQLTYYTYPDVTGSYNKVLAALFALDLLSQYILSRSPLTGLKRFKIINLSFVTCRFVVFPLCLLKLAHRSILVELFGAKSASNNRNVFSSSYSCKDDRFAENNCGRLVCFAEKRNLMYSGCRMKKSRNRFLEDS